MMQMNKMFMLLAIGLVGLSGCQKEAAVWGYGANDGPNSWATLSSDYELCSSGQAQSPINIESDMTEKGNDKLDINYSETNFNIVDTGHSIEFEDQSGNNTISYNGDTYTLEQIHFHNQSENTIDGQHYPLEAHFVHENSHGQNLVISVMFNVGQVNQVIGNSFTMVGEQTMFNPIDLIPTQTTHYSFMGSLTTPPCSEDVQWIVFEQPLALSEQQLADFTTHYASNNREPQPLYERVVEYNQ